MALLAVCLARAAPAAAQTQTGANLAVGYSFLREFNTPGTNYGAGWTVSMATASHATTSVVGEIGGNFRKPAGVFQQLHSFLGGVRVMPPALGRVAPFAQALAGVERFSESGFSQTGFAVQPGGGVDVSLGAKIAVRGQADFRWVRADRQAFKEARFGAGLVVHF